MSSSSSSSQSSQSSQGSPVSQVDQSSSSVPIATYTRGIRLKRLIQSRYNANGVDGFRFRVLAYDAYLMPDEIFLFQREPYNLNTGEEADVFTSVCSSVDLQEYPVGAPSGTPAFFRQAEIDLIFRSRAQADDAWDLIKKAVDVLVRSLNTQDEMEESEVVTYGAPPTSGSSSSAS